MVRNSSPGEKRLLCVVYVAMAVYVYAMNSFMPYYDDDIWYSYRYVAAEELSPLRHIGDVFESQYWHYIDENGRAVVHVLLQTLLGFLPETLFDILNTVMFLLLLTLVAGCVAGSLRFSTVLFAGAALWWAKGARGLVTPPEIDEASSVDRVVILKKERRLLLMSGEKIAREYRISLGPHPEGHKTREGDGKTPEGIEVKGTYRNFTRNAIGDIEDIGGLSPLDYLVAMSNALGYKKASTPGNAKPGNATISKNGGNADYETAKKSGDVMGLIRNAPDAKLNFSK